MVKNLPASVRDIRDVGSSLGWKGPLEKEMTTYSSILAWEIPRTEEPELQEADMTEVNKQQQEKTYQKELSTVCIALC